MCVRHFHEPTECARHDHKGMHTSAKEVKWRTILHGNFISLVCLRRGTCQLFSPCSCTFCSTCAEEGSHGALARTSGVGPLQTWLPLQASLLGAWVFSFKLDLQWGSSSLLQYLYGLTEARPQREYSGVRSQTRIGKKRSVALGHIFWAHLCLLTQYGKISSMFRNLYK